ncbi:MAG: M42 family metallopeptidase [bacterium JZ-2024 1]
MASNLKNDLFALINAWGVVGRERPVRDFVLSRVRNIGVTKVDGAGNLWLTVGKGKKKIAFLAHLDELGFAISRITERGSARFQLLGGIDERVLPGRVVEFMTRYGDVLQGVIGITPPHLTPTAEERARAIKISDMEVYFGFSSREEAESEGLSVTDLGRFSKAPFMMRKDLICGRALDDRAGCAVLVHLAERLQVEPPTATVSIIWTVQEEFGLRGAKAVARTSFDEVYIVDTISATQELAVNTPPQFSEIGLGKGPVVRFLDRAHIASEALVAKVEDVASEEGINLQYAVSGGTTDAAAVFEGGSPAVPIAIPLAFTHSPVEIASLTDVEQAIEICVALTR